ncbi:peptide deformylase [Anthocerotibacter panamensis]|uniref:peptide deformylase n=1 Tax=Anthocerotibacter panamensis TaxID=2857077 RepID=UPI001C40374E|nr:peptide deformylase [Anthocerotibacter panamensis]
MTMRIYTLGEPVLQQQADPVENIHAPSVQNLIDELIATLREANGVGIAAPQVGVSLQVLILASRPNLRYPHAPTMEPIAIINPRILDQAPATVWDWEGCLSVPDCRGLVLRSEWITVAYTNRAGSIEVATFRDFVARIFQHEYDHLTGKVFLDYQPKQVLNEVQYQAQIIGLPA